MPLIIKQFFKKIITFYLILSLIFLSPLSFSALPAAAVGLGTVIGYGLNTPAGKKIMKKIGDSIFGDDNPENSTSSIDDSGSVYLYHFGNGCNSNGSQSGPFYSLYEVLKRSSNYFSQMYGGKDVYYQIHEKNKTNSGFIFHVNWFLDDDDRQIYSSSVHCFNPQEKKLEPEEVYEKIKQLAEKGDEDAKKVKKDIDDEIERRKKEEDEKSDDSTKKDDDDTTDDDDSTKKKDDDDDDTSDDKCTNDDTSDDDDTCKKDDDTSEKNDDDDEKCSTSAFHKKVCDWIDWTYEETDKAKKKIADFLNDDEIDKIDKEKLNHLVNEEDVTLKTYNFDIADACPAPRKVTSSLFGRTIEIEVFNFEGICRYAGLIEFALETTSTIIAINIIAGRKAD